MDLTNKTKGLNELNQSFERSFFFRTKLKSQINNYVIKHSLTLHDQFQFAWTNDLELLSNIGR
jgi:hypothetical protein